MQFLILASATFFEIKHLESSKKLTSLGTQCIMEKRHILLVFIIMPLAPFFDTAKILVENRMSFLRPIRTTRKYDPYIQAIGTYWWLVRTTHTYGPYVWVSKMCPYIRAVNMAHI